MPSKTSTLLRARIDSTRYRKAEEVFQRLGIKSSDAVNMFFAQVALRDDLPFTVTAHPEKLISDEAQAEIWNNTYGEY